MAEWSDEIHDVLLQLKGYMNRPDIDQAFLARAGVKLDRALFPLLTVIGLSHPIGVVELASLVGRDHSTVSRQVAKLEALGLVERQGAKSDQRVRLLHPSDPGRQMLAQFAAARRKVLNERLGDWTSEDQRMLLDLLKRFSSTMAAGFERPSDAKPSRSKEGRERSEARWGK
ncbi:MAG TPA: MarR family transcriptional regulator [Caulobacteraceae bacterium]|nr:MarR family transcriptional regulator [Caulobacteraceae bacterium]